VPFRRILGELIATTPGAIGAIFLDYEGETVEMLCERPFDADEHDLKILGAYQGIFLTQLRRITEQVEAGKLDRFKIEFTGTKVFSCDLQDGYYVVLVTDASSLEAVVWQHLVSCRDQLLAEM
jgi:predicted regulator of Ras-like GTPase activity (Roadblock/LC7/MglB family)